MAETNEKKKKNNLSIYLIKEEFTDFDKIVQDASVLETFNDNKKAYYKSSCTDEPKWAKGFFKKSYDKVFQANSRAVLLTRLEVAEGVNRIFAVTFGYGKNLLVDDVCEEQFGLKIVLNTVPKTNLRKLSKADIGNNQKLSQEQLPRESSILEFGFDEQKELVRYVTGRCVDKEFDNMIVTGGDMFSIVADKDISDIDDFLIYCYEIFLSKKYEQDYSWVDNYKFIKDKNLIEQLNQKVVDNFNAKNFDNVWLAVPEVIEWEKVSGFAYSGHTDTTPDIEFEKFLSTFANGLITDFKHLSSKWIKAMSSESDRETAWAYRWTANKCIVGTIEHNGKRYAINFGKWYEIKSTFANEIASYYSAIDISQIKFAGYENETENDYIDKTIKVLNGAKKIHPTKTYYSGIAGNSVEPCDMIYDNNLIYLKRQGGSEHLSHLFSQANVASEALTTDDFRNKTNKALTDGGIDYQFANNFDARGKKIVIGILSSRTDKRPKIPFFSMVSIKNAMVSIKSRGYSFELINIGKEIPQEIAHGETAVNGVA